MKKIRKMMAILIVAVLTMMLVPATVFAANLGTLTLNFTFTGMPESRKPVVNIGGVDYNTHDTTNGTYRTISGVDGSSIEVDEPNKELAEAAIQNAIGPDKLIKVSQYDGYDTDVDVTVTQIDENSPYNAIVNVAVTYEESQGSGSGNGGSAATPGTGSITINNAANGETYTLYKVIGATINSNGGIDYDGSGFPPALANYFELKQTQDDQGRTYQYLALMNEENVLGANDTIPQDIVDAFKTWADTATETAHVKASNGQAVFENVDPGYYVITSSLGNVIMIDSATNPAAQVYEKNEGTPVYDLKKLVDSGNENVQIGDTVTYTISFNTANYSGSGAGAKQIISYVLKDALPASLTASSYTIKVNGTTVQTAGDLFGENGATVTWATPVENSNPVTYTSLYDNDSTIEVTYTATVNAAASGAITNTVTIDYLDADDESIPGDNKPSTEKTIYTYAIDIEKTDGTNALTGAQFKLYNEATNGNQIYVTGSNGTYVVSATETDILIEAGHATVTGLDSDRTYYLEEVKAPDGYNKLTSRQEVTPRAVSETTETYNAVAANAEFDENETYYIMVNDEYQVTTSYNAENFGGRTETVYTRTVTTETLTTTSYVAATEYVEGTRYYSDDKGENEVTIADAAAFEAYDGTLYKATTTAVAPGFDTITVINNAGAELPSTGGIGTTIFYIIGAILVIGGGIVLVTRRRMG